MTSTQAHPVKNVPQKPGSVGALSSAGIQKINKILIKKNKNIIYESVRT